MEFKSIFFKPNLFSNTQFIIGVTADNKNIELGHTTIREAPKDLINACAKYNISNIHLFGNNTFIEKIKLSIMETKEYSNNKIKVEVN